MHQISILEWFLNDYVMLNTGVMINDDQNSALITEINYILINV